MANSAPTKIYISLEFTPNPNTLKYAVNLVINEGATASFIADSPDAHKDSPLVEKLFEIPGMAGVMIGRDFVTVTKTLDGDWDKIHQTTSQLLETYLGAGNPVFVPGYFERRKSGSVSHTETERKIVDFLNEQIKPAVAMDGGDITFDRFEDGVVYLYMQGSCSGCPSSTATLKMGIETRLKEIVPEVVEVVAI